ncbi:hypothetical protein D3C78_1622500 [compost metagenome]
MFQHIGQIEVVERDHRFNAVLEQFIDQVTIKRQARLIHLARAVGQNARPGYGETVRLQP